MACHVTIILRSLQGDPSHLISRSANEGAESRIQVAALPSISRTKEAVRNDETSRIHFELAFSKQFLAEVEVFTSIDEFAVGFNIAFFEKLAQKARPTVQHEDVLSGIAVLIAIQDDVSERMDV